MLRLTNRLQILATLSLLSMTAACPVQPEPGAGDVDVDVDVEGDQLENDEDVTIQPSFVFEAITLDGIEPRFGASVAGDIVAAGIVGDLEADNGVFAINSDGAVPVASRMQQLAIPRFMACAFFDEERRELIVVGGRDAQYRDTKTAEGIQVDTGERFDVAVESGVASHPIGCQAFWSPTVGVGYVYGGKDSATQGLGGTTYRYDSATRSFDVVTLEGPPARYDASVHVLDDGDGLLIGGMGQDSLSFRRYADLWRFDVTTERWSLLPAASEEDVAPGRRWPWTAVAPDESQVLMGFGTDSPSGDSMLGDLWSFEIASGQWTRIDWDGEVPEPRAFTTRLPGPPGSVGVLAFGCDEALNVYTDAFTLRPPEPLVGRWH